MHVPRFGRTAARLQALAMTRPHRMVVVLGTGTEVGKTWVACRLLEHLRAAGLAVAVRKPAQSWDADDVAAGQPTDAVLLAGAAGEAVDDVCPPHRSFGLPLAPPMAADRLGRPPIALADLVAELRWPAAIDVGLVEAAGGSRSPLAHDADGADLARALQPDVVVLVADAGLGTLHAVRAALDGLTGLPTVIALNRYDPDDELHAANRAWLTDRDRLDVVITIEDLAEVVSFPS